MTQTRLFICCILCLAVVLLGAASAQAAQSGAPEGTPYAGADKCSTCHEEVATGLSTTVHGSNAFAMRSDKGCETCHGPGTAHIDKEGDKSLIRSFKALSPSEASAVCLGCHQNGDRTNWAGNVHDRRNVACVECHTIHHGKSERYQLKTVKIEETCARCHAPIMAQLMRTSHHPIREGLISCVDCHNPHGTEIPKMISANSVNEKCYQCHTEKRGPFLWDHPPVRESCLNCHVPHGSSHTKLLVMKRPYLCQRCHMDTRHPGSLYDASNLLTNNRELSRACSNCHLNLHGSNHPSGKFFLR